MFSRIPLRCIRATLGYFGLAVAYVEDGWTMVLYRRHFVSGGSFFFTVALLDRRATTLVDHFDLLRGAFLAVHGQRPFRTEAMVVLPDHLHVIWTLPDGDADFSGRWQAIKSAFVRALAKTGVASARNARGEAPVWQRRFWEHTLSDEADFANHCAYIHYNPVKHGLVTTPTAWPHSTIHRFIEQGLYPPGWAVPATWGAEPAIAHNRGEPA